MSKLIISRMEIHHILCEYWCLLENNRMKEFHFQPTGKKNILHNIYVGQVDSINPNIQAAFIKIDKDTPCYFSLKEQEQLLYTHPRHKKLAVGDQVIVQVIREGMKGKPPAVTANLNFTGTYLVLTSGITKLGYSSKLTKEEKARLRTCFDDEDLSSYGIVVRTNARDIEKELLLKELTQLKKRYERILNYGSSRTCYSLLEESDTLCQQALRSVYSSELEEILTDIPEIHLELKALLECDSMEQTYDIRFYKDNLLSLKNLYGIEKKFRELDQEKVWLKSGGFLVIQQTDAFLSIDVNTGKFAGKKKAEETFRKINLEAAAEIAYHLRARRLSGIILVDFINLSSKAHIEELLNVFQRHLKKDPVSCIVHDITKLNIVEVTRKKIEKPLGEQLLELEKIAKKERQTT